MLCERRETSDRASSSLFFRRCYDFGSRRFRKKSTKASTRSSGTGCCPRLSAVTPPVHADFLSRRTVATGTPGPFRLRIQERRTDRSSRSIAPGEPSPRCGLRSRREPGAIIVMVRGGDYALRATFALAAGDSGTAQSSTIYENYPGETPVLSGACVSRTE